MIGVKWEEERKDEEDRREKRETKQAKLLSQRSRTDKNKGREENIQFNSISSNAEQTKDRQESEGKRQKR
jgi:hypothetical protein